MKKIFWYFGLVGFNVYFFQVRELSKKFICEWK